MAHYQVGPASLTPSRPAPAAPIRRGNDVQNVLASSGYGSSFSVGTSSPSGSSYASSYSGIGGSPNRNSDMSSSSHIVRSGLVAIKEDGIVSWLWRPKWLVLKEQTLSIHKNEVSTLFHTFLLFDLEAAVGRFASYTAFLARVNSLAAIDGPVAGLGLLEGGDLGRNPPRWPHRTGACQCRHSIFPPPSRPDTPSSPWRAGPQSPCYPW